MKFKENKSNKWKERIALIVLPAIAVLLYFSVVLSSPYIFPKYIEDSATAEQIVSIVELVTPIILCVLLYRLSTKLLFPIDNESPDIKNNT